MAMSDTLPRAALASAVLAALLFAGAGCPRAPGAAAPRGLKVAASFYPLAYFASKVGGELVAVTNLTPAGAEPHEYEPSPQQVASVHDADVLLYNGAGIDAWAERLAPSLRAKGVTVLAVSSGVGALLPPPDPGEAMPNDPHVWLDPALAQQIVVEVRDALSARDPAHAEAYRANADRAVAELGTLDKEFEAGLSRCERHTAITAHASLGYLARRYGFTQLPIAGLSPDEEPSARRLADIAKEAKADEIRYIFFETLVSPQLARTIAQEIGAQTLVFNPLEGLTNDELAAGKDYLSVQRDNLANLRIALQCR